MTKQKAENLDVPFDMSDEAIERRGRDVAQLPRLGVRMKSATLTGRKVEASKPENK